MQRILLHFTYRKATAIDVRIQRRLDVGQAETVGDQHDEAHAAIENVAPEHTARDDNRGILRFFGHVSVSRRLVAGQRR